jgi:hypothetical protein
MDGDALCEQLAALTGLRQLVLVVGQQVCVVGNLLSPASRWSVQKCGGGVVTALRCPGDFE